MMGLVQLIGRTNLRDIKVPVQFIYSRKDRVVDADEISRRYSSIGSQKKQIIALAQSEDIAHHVLVGDILNPKNTSIAVQLILEFLKPILPR